MGAHSDVGGSYPFHQSGLSHNALQWMIREARAFGLDFDDLKIREEIPITPTATNSAPDVNGMDSSVTRRILVGFRMVAEKGRATKKWISPWGQPRNLFIDAQNSPIRLRVHLSATRRRGYSPRFVGCNLASPSA